MTTNEEKSYIGLDVGERRIGVARVHSFAGIAEPLPLIEVEKADVQQTIISLVVEHQADGIVVGLPRGLDGQETAQTQYCRQFAEELAQSTIVPVYLIDEAGTSKLADARIRDTPGISRDSMAAAILLEDFVQFQDKDVLQVMKQGQTNE